MDLKLEWTLAASEAGCWKFEKWKLSKWATWQTHHAFVKYLFFQLIRTTIKKVLFLKTICGMLLFETLKIKKSDFLNSNTCFCSRLYGSTNCCYVLKNVTKKPAYMSLMSNLYQAQYCNIIMLFINIEFKTWIFCITALCLRKQYVFFHFV